MSQDGGYPLLWDEAESNEGDTRRPLVYHPPRDCESRLAIPSLPTPALKRQPYSYLVKLCDATVVSVGPSSQGKPRSTQARYTEQNRHLSDCAPHYQQP
eukprot:g68130.t1